MKKTCLIIQSGALGDIFIVAPIARYYQQQGYLVYWPIRSIYYETVRRYFPYVSPLLIDAEYIRKNYRRRTGDWLKDDAVYLSGLTKSANYDLVLNLADRGSASRELPGETFEETKYRLARVPYDQKHRLHWKRNRKREMDLFNLLVPKEFRNNYSLVHTTSSHGDRAELPVINNYVIEARQIDGFYIPDLYFTAVNATKVYVVESAVHQFMDGITGDLKKNGVGMYLLSRPSLSPGQRYTKSEWWFLKYMK